MVREPNYKRIARLLEGKIRSGEYPPGHRLPPERRLCEIFGVSRITARQAMAELARSELVIRRQGQGSFVARSRIESSLLGFFSISEALKADGRLVATRVIHSETSPPDSAEIITLGCKPGDEIFRITRLRLVDGDPYALEKSALPITWFPGLDRYDFNMRSLYEVLNREYDTRLVRARETLAPVLLTPEQADLLQVDVSQPALRLVRTTFDSANVATEASEALIRGDRCQLLFELWADQRSSAKAG